jgi:Transposase DDE domain
LQVLLRNDSEKCFIIDSFPVRAYENHKSFRARIFSGKQYHGYTASKKQYFFGIKVHMLIDARGIPIEFSFTPASNSDVRSLQNLALHLEKGSLILADRAYTCYEIEDLLLECDQIALLPKRKACSKRQHCAKTERLLRERRNRIETVFSSIVRRMPRYIRAATEKGFCLKVVFFILAYMTNIYSSTC